ncbi:MAG: hypothetical protein A3J14_02020 [Candidatus Levybacteria bacterium RIFCSPLOWO2_02_FULL_37_18]|nr:MAG: hypothetical protein A3J14_02020 [Candidatus Levybacteria bacterium RIFCSPLOWO2_02_FULL_37_18]
MKILILNWRDIKHPLAGGAEISTHEHAKGWVKAGHEVFQFSSSFPNAKKEEVIDSIRIIRRGNHYTVHLYAFFYFLRYLRKRIDLIIDEFHFIPFFTPLYTKSKKLAFIHETAEEIWLRHRLFPINIIGYFIEPLFFKLYRNIPFMTVSNSTKNDLVRFGINKNNITIINNGVNIVKRRSEKEKTATIICLNKLSNDKGSEDAIYAFHEVLKYERNTHLWMVGKEDEKGYKEKLKQIAKNLGIENKIFFFGFVSEEKKFNLLGKAWILIHPSIKEGWGLNVIEAASCGTPTVAYDTSGLRDAIVDGQTGLLVKKRNPIELGRSIYSLLNNQQFYNILSKNALAWSKKFDWKKSAEESLKLIENII